MVHPQAAGAHDTTTTSPLQFRADGSRPRLTSQERHVLSLLIQGHHKKTAADVMGISVNTVSFHLKNVYLKLEVHSKTEAVVKALLEGLVVSPGPGPGVER